MRASGRAAAPRRGDLRLLAGGGPSGHRRSRGLRAHQRRAGSRRRGKSCGCRSRCLGRPRCGETAPARTTPGPPRGDVDANRHPAARIRARRAQRGVRTGHRGPPRAAELGPRRRQRRRDPGRGVPRLAGRKLHAADRDPRGARRPRRRGAAADRHRPRSRLDIAASIRADGVFRWPATAGEAWRSTSSRSCRRAGC